MKNKPQGFKKQYWKENYSEPETMDGIGNAKDHARYIHSVFALEGIEINSILDLGFGLGVLGREVSNKLKCKRYDGIEPSQYAFERMKNDELELFKAKKVEIEETDMLSGLKHRLSLREEYDLAICSSVLQYCENEYIKECIEHLSKSVKYLYLSVPTDKELERQVKELDYFDKFAIRRSKEDYMELISPCFSVVSLRLLESRHYFDEKSTDFTDLLFHF